MVKQRFFPCTLEGSEGKRYLRFFENSLAGKENAERQGESFYFISSFRRQLVEGSIRIHGKPVEAFLVATSGLDSKSYLKKLAKRFQRFLPEATVNTIWLDVKDHVALTLIKKNQQDVVLICESMSRR